MLSHRRVLLGGGPAALHQPWAVQKRRSRVAPFCVHHPAPAEREGAPRTLDTLLRGLERLICPPCQPTRAGGLPRRAWRYPPYRASALSLPV